MSTLTKPVVEINKKPRKDYQKRSLIKKLAAACSEVEMVEKNGVAYWGDYLRACDLYRALRGKLFKANVMIFADDEREEWQEITVTGQDGLEKKMRQCTLHTKFHLEDGDSGETREYKAIGISVNDSEKALYAAKTGAQKYFLKGLGLIVDEDEDPEFDVAANTPKQLVGKIKDMRKTALTLIVDEKEVKVKVEDQVLADRLHANKGEDVKLDYFDRVNGYGKPFKLLTHPQNLVLGKFQAAAKANPVADLTAVLEISKEQAELLKFMERAAREKFGEEWSDRLAEIIGHANVHQLTETEITDICDRMYGFHVIPGGDTKPPQPVVSIAEGERQDEIIGAD